MDSEIHTSDECQKYWRDRFADQLDEAQRRDWGADDDENMDRANWFNEGIRYAMLIIRWDYDDPSDDQP